MKRDRIVVENTIEIMMEIEQKLKQLAKKHKIPEELLKEAIALEKERIMYANRQCVPKLLKAIARYAE
ncbi:hypothetical protein Ple7327_3789 [Pleurocapsa sp. PCC 7327]|nr:hypothetical protein Ple7327_3789 [Pleurocapsa sp. PCC 7327]